MVNKWVCVMERLRLDPGPLMLGAATLLWALPSALVAQDADPLASNNGVYPSAEEWSGTLRTANLAYPRAPVDGTWGEGPLEGLPLTVDRAPAYAEALKGLLEPSLRGMVETPHDWRPQDHGWYDMVWSGQGQRQSDGSIDPTSGREPILSTYTGQILPQETWTAPYTPQVDVQNHAVIYYNDVAAGMLGQLWADLYAPDVGVVDFPPGSIVVKAEAATPSVEQWGVLSDAAVWHVFRPSVATQQGGAKTPEVLELRLLQMSIAVKDPIASPETGWVYLAYVYAADAPGAQPWDRMVPLGVQWGNDPDFAENPDGVDPQGGGLRESWINPGAPAFALQTLGWGGRLSGPMDVATRHNVVTPSGARYEGDDRFRASSCLSCHGSAEFPFTRNLYPSPNRSFPPDGQPFLLYDPGTPEWAEWFQNRPGGEPMPGGRVALDYDMVIMFALSAYNAAMGGDRFVQSRLHGH